MSLLKTNNQTTYSTEKLSVQITLTGLSFLVSTTEGIPIFFTEEKALNTYNLEELLTKLTHTITTTKELQTNFSSVTLIYTTNNYTLVPMTLFDKNKASEYLKMNTKILSNDHISYDIINKDIATVYVPFMNINNYIFDYYGAFQYFHSSGILIKTILNIEKFTVNKKVYLHIIKKQFECIVIENGGLQLCNSYQYETPEDFIYYILFCFEQLHLDPEKTETVVCGDLHKNDKLYTILHRYIRNVSFLDKSLPVIEKGQENHNHFLLKAIL